MIRLFKHYIPHAVMLLGLFDLVLLLGAGEIAWQVRARQIDIDPGPIADRAGMLAGFAGAVHVSPSVEMIRVRSSPTATKQPLPHTTFRRLSSGRALR